jgi:hypothetical protein
MKRAILICLMAAAVFVLWWNNRPPADNLTYQVMVDHNGAPLEVPPGAILQNVAQFRLRLHAVRVGYFYVFGQSPSDTTVLHILYAPDGAAALRDLETNWIPLGRGPGEDMLWMLWSPTMLPGVDQIARSVSAPVHAGTVRDTTDVQHLRGLFASPGRGVLVRRLVLKHR